MSHKSNGVNDASMTQSLIRESWDPVQRAERRIEAVRRLRKLEQLLCSAASSSRAS
jgi:hypothetical protein